MVNYIHTNLPVNIESDYPIPGAQIARAYIIKILAKIGILVKLKYYPEPILVKTLKVILRRFFHLLDKHFGRNHKYHKIFNRNNVKISYSCMDNIKNIISSHSKEIANF